MDKETDFTKALIINMGDPEVYEKGIQKEKDMMEKEVISYEADKKRCYRSTNRFDWENLKVGDYVFTECLSSFGSGGYGYDSGEEVTKLTKEHIECGENKYFRGNLNSIKHSYFIYCWEEKSGYRDRKGMDKG